MIAKKQSEKPAGKSASRDTEDKAAKVSDAKNKQVELMVKELQDKYGDGSIMRLGQVSKVDVDVIPTGSISLDVALGVGGVPRGRIIEIYGPESSGKTTLCLHIVSEAQKAGGVAAYVDAEHALDPEYAKRIGVKIDQLLISQPDTGEQALDIVESLVKSGGIDVIVVDSVAALTPRAEIEGEMDQQHVGVQARLMSHALRKLTASVAKSKTTVIFINQLRMKIGIMFGNPETTPGGMALKFYSSVRIEIRKSAQIQAGEKIVGNRVKIKIVKNKVAPPFRTCEFDILYNEGISRQADIINAGVRYNILTKSGSWFSYNGEKIGQGIDGARNYLKENPKIEKELVKKIKDAAAAEELAPITEEAKPREFKR
ncbi:MAG TPA: recombinase RecA [Candidatus Paceibacterota bacterium]|nr:recombinase RecA [Candidatus Paceibacterota bacterium]